MPKGVPNAPLIDRFLQRVQKTDTCWNWTGGKSNGYGALREWVWGDSYTHIWSYKYHKGEIPDKKVVRHTCDNRCCVNPDHLILGDPYDNIKDMLERHPKPCNRRFTKEQVEEIKQLRSQKKTYPEIAKVYNCNRRTIERIFTGMYYS